MITGITDSHCHYNDERFEKEFQGGRSAAIEMAKENGCSFLINAATDIDTTISAKDLSTKYPGLIFYTAGLWPCDAQNISNKEEKVIFDKIEELSEDAVAIGEIGLDYHYDGTNKERQLYFLEKQFNLAIDLGLPVVIHDREAHGDTMDMIMKYPKIRGMMHSFSGSSEMAKQLVDLGWFISVSGTVTFKNAVKIKKTVAETPVENLLVETDCPYLAPEPFRGQINDSAYLQYTISKIAEIKEIEPQKIADTTTKNAMDFFNISKN